MRGNEWQQNCDRLKHMLAEATAHDYETHCRARARCRHPSGEFVPFAREEIEQSIPARFSKIVARYPDRPAIQEGERTLTYTELNQAANCVAHRLLELCGPQPEPIATLFDHGTDAIVALLGVLKAGKFYAPLHPPDPAARHRSIVESAGAPIILTDAQNATAARKVAGQGRQVIEVDARISEPALPDPAIAIAPDRCAYLLYTSGSTGEPKGVVMDQRSTLHATMSYTNSCGMCAADRTALVSYLSFSGHVQPVFTALLNGGAVLPFDVPREGVRKLAAWLAEEEITVFIGVAVFRHMAQTFAPGDTFPHLRLIYHGGGPAFRSDLELYRRHFCDDCIFVNSFATTETKAIRRIFLDKQIELAGEVVPVGYAVDDVDIAVWNEAGQPVAEGEAGEIVAHTPFLASGYWQNEELTQARFVPDPHHPGQRAYRTGDLGKLLPDGCLLHLGRIDHQVKIRGHRVELTEVEGLLGRQPGVREAAVHPFQNRHGDQALAAYVAPDRPGMNAETLRAALNGRLPDYMTPARYIFLESLPRMTASGKVDRNALPQPERVRPSLAQAYAGPITPLESRLADIWAEVLDLDRVGVEDRFTDLGGDSLAAARLLAALDELTGRDLPFSVLLERARCAIWHACSRIARGRPGGSRS